MTSIPTRARLRKAAGPERPTYLKPVDTDTVMAVMLALIAEVSTLRERLDTHEQLAAAGIVASAEQVENFAPPESLEAEREALRTAYIDRLFRVVTEELDAAELASAD